MNSNIYLLSSVINLFPSGLFASWFAMWSICWVFDLKWVAGSTCRQRDPMSSSPTTRAPWMFWVGTLLDASTVWTIRNIRNIKEFLQLWHKCQSGHEDILSYFFWLNVNVIYWIYWTDFFCLFVLKSRIHMVTLQTFKQRYLPLLHQNDDMLLLWG